MYSISTLTNRLTRSDHYYHFSFTHYDVITLKSEYEIQVKQLFKIEIDTSNILSTYSILTLTNRLTRSDHYYHFSFTHYDVITLKSEYEKIGKKFFLRLR